MTYHHSAALCMFASISCWLASPVLAAEPSIAQCLEASDASFEHENAHRLRAARAELLVCASRSCPAEIRAECARRVEELNEAIPTILFEVEDAAGQELSDVRVTMDGDLLVERLEGIALPIDPGVHAFRFEAANQRTAERRFVVRQAQKNRVELVRLSSADASAEESALDKRPTRTPPAGTDAHGGARRKLAVISASLGVVALGAGATFGLLALKQRDRAREICPTDCSSQDGVERWQDAKRWGNSATASFAVGATAVVGAALLSLLGKPRSVATSAQAWKGTAAFAVGGRW